MTLAEGAGWRIYQDTETERIFLELQTPYGPITLAGWNGETLSVLQSILTVYRTMEMGGPL